MSKTITRAIARRMQQSYERCGQIIPPLGTGARTTEATAKTHAANLRRAAIARAAMKRGGAR